MENAVLIDGLRAENAALKAELAEVKWKLDLLLEQLSNDSLRTENAALRAELAEVKGKLDWLLEQLSNNRRKMYGASSEKGVYDGGVQMGLFPESHVDVQAFGVLEQSKPEPHKSRPAKRGEMGTRLPPGLPVTTIVVELPEERRECPEGHGPMRPIGKVVVRREVKINPASVEIIEYVQTSYSCQPCEKTADGPPLIVKAELPPQVIKGSMCAPETVAHIIVEKCVMGSPLYRQEQNWNRSGIPFTRQTMANWLIQCSEAYLEPIYDELHRRLCLHIFLHSDGTTFQVLKEPGKTPQSKSCMWVYRTSGDAENPITLYEHQPDKTQERPREFLSGFSGYLLTDGSSSYNGLPDDVILVGCFAHVRRRFVDALKVLKKAEDREGSLALTGVRYCDKLFEIERGIKDKPFGERYDIRNEKAAPILDGFRVWLESAQPHVAPKSMIGKAVNYALNQWKHLIRYLLDGRIEISNNRCERSVKPFVINRKNFLFADTVAGARAAAVLHMTETAKESGLDPFKYLTHVFKTAAGTDLRENRDMIVSLLPENAPESCKAILD